MKIVHRMHALHDGREWGVGDTKKYKGITIHRVGKNRKYNIDLGDTADEIIPHFTGENKTYPEVAKAVGYRVPYTFLIGSDGTIYQTLPLVDKGAHARRWSGNTIGVALIGDFRYEEPTPNQFFAAAELCSELCLGFMIDADACIGKTPTISGHTERPGSSSDPSKECPGKMFPMDKFRETVSTFVVGIRKATLGAFNIAMNIEDARE